MGSSNSKLALDLDPKISCILHSTSIEGLEGILKNGYVATEFDRFINELELPAGYTTPPKFSSKEENKLCLGQYPGVFCDVITDDLFNKPIKYIKGEKSVLIHLVFPPELILKGDCHFNINDVNGYFDDPDNTITNFENLSSYIDYGTYHELVFHNRISIEYLQEIWVNPKIYNKVMKLDAIKNGICKVRVISTKKIIDKFYNVGYKIPKELTNYCFQFRINLDENGNEIVKSFKSVKCILSNCDIRYDPSKSFCYYNLLIYDKLQKMAQNRSKILRRQLILPYK